MKSLFEKREYYKLYQRRYRKSSAWIKYTQKHKESGVYIIWSKTFPERCYIGSSEDFYNRKRSHFYHLKNNTSNHLKLQDHVNEFGLDDLVFEIIEKCNKDHLVYKEQYYISEYNPCFNVNKYASFHGNKASSVAWKDMARDKDYKEIFHSDGNILKYCDKEFLTEIIIPINI